MRVRITCQKEQEFWSQTAGSPGEPDEEMEVEMEVRAQKGRETCERKGRKWPGPGGGLSLPHRPDKASASLVEHSGANLLVRGVPC